MPSRRISLLELAAGAHAAPLVRRVREAPDLEEPGGDYL
jgi:hypothetical protein